MRLVIHLGLPKTGTTSLQHFLATDVRFTRFGLWPSQQVHDPAAAVRRREEGRQIFPTATDSDHLQPANSQQIRERSETLTRIIQAHPNDAPLVLTYESISDSICSRSEDNFAVLKLALRTLRSASSDVNVQILQGVRHPVSLATSMASYSNFFMQHQDQEGAIENWFQANWHSRKTNVFRQGHIARQALDLNPDSLHLLPIELLHVDPAEFHQRLSKVLAADLSDLPLLNIRLNARDSDDSTDRLGRTLTGKWRALRTAQVKLEGRFGTQLREKVPAKLSRFYAERLEAAFIMKQLPLLSSSFSEWLLAATREDSELLRNFDPSLDWDQLGYSKSVEDL